MKWTDYWCSNPALRITDRIADIMTDRSHNLALVEVGGGSLVLLRKWMKYSISVIFTRQRAAILLLSLLFFFCVQLQICSRWWHQSA